MDGRHTYFCVWSARGVVPASFNNVCNRSYNRNLAATKSIITERREEGGKEMKEDGRGREGERGETYSIMD